MQAIRERNSILYVIILAVFIISGNDATAATIVAQSGTKPAPIALETQPGVMAESPANPDAERERREAALRTHFFLGPLEIVPEAAMQAIQPPPPTAVRALGAPQANQVVLFENHGLTDAETNNITSTVNEPSVATRGQEVLLTANWYAAFSNDGGSSFSYLNPDNFPSVDGGFCCDQLALYNESNDLMVWFLQYIKSSSGNTARIAVAQGPTGIPNQQWSLYDFTPQDVGLSGVWFDYPAMAAGKDFLYITLNAFTLSSDQFTKAVAIRVPLANLASGQGFTYDFFTTSNFSLRPTQGASNTMFFGSHQSTTTLRLFSWPENANNIVTTDIAVQPWNITSNSGWLGRVDPRITAGWTVGDEVGFGWTASADANIPNTHVRVAVIDSSTNSLTGQPHLWSPDVSYAYLAAAPNSQNEIGVSVSFGNGSSVHPSHAVGLLAGMSRWELVTTVSGTHEPLRSVWGDYLSVSRHGSDGDHWVATGFTLQGGRDSSDIQTRYVEFGVGSVPPGPQQIITLMLQRPGDVLEKGESEKAFAKVTLNGVLQPNVRVNFASLDTNLATVSPASSMTNAQGEAETTVKSLGSSGPSTTNVMATIDGSVISDSKPVTVNTVKAPGFGLAGLFVVLLGMILLNRYAVRRS